MDLHNISVISHYEVRLLRRSWLFKIFAILALLGITLVMLFMHGNVINRGDAWGVTANPSLMPFACTYYYNIAQSVIAIFLAGSFLKRDKKLDTAEVIYVRPMSNADYIIGKTWGIMRVFISLNIIMLLITAFLNLFVSVSPFRVLPYLFYLVTISIPSLLFVLGLSFTMMCLLKNQAVTFIVMLGIIGMSFFYLSENLHGVFDFFGVNIPAIFSDITGHANLGVFLLQRLIYLLAGIGLICFTISLVKRLPHRPWKIIIVNSLGTFFLLCGCIAGIGYVLHFTHIANERSQFAATFNKYASAAKTHITDHNIVYIPQGDRFSAESRLELTNGNAETLKNIVLYLNPALTVSEIVDTNNSPLPFTRDQQVILIEKQLAPDDKISLTIKYGGTINENICYTDIEDKEFFETKTLRSYRLGKRYAWVTDNYTLLTPETIWYPISIPPVNPQAPYYVGKSFTDFSLRVIQPKGKMALSQGESTISKDTVIFTNRIPLMGLSLTIADYEKKAIQVDSVEYSIFHFRGHDFFSEHFSLLKDTLPSVIQDFKNDLENEKGRSYPFQRLSMIETPVQFATYIRNWKGYTEYTQPEIVFFIERALNSYADFGSRKKMMKEWNNQRGEDGMDPVEIERDMFYSYFHNMLWNEISYNYTMSKREESVNPTNVTPLFFGFTGYISSPEFPIIDIALNSMQNTSTQMSGWWGDIINDKQKANQYLEDKSFMEATEDPEIEATVFFELLKLKSNALKNYIYSKVPEESFNQFLTDFFLRNRFTEIPLSKFDNEFTEEFGFSLHDFMKEWYTLKQTPTLFIREVDANQVIVDDITRYQVKFKVWNSSGTDAIITAQTQQGGGWGRRGGRNNSENVTLNYVIPANEAREIKMITDERPASLAVNTNISHNLPTLRTFNFSKIDNTVSDTTRGIFPASQSVFAKNPNEIIIDNEDEGFRIIQSNKRQKLKDLLRKKETEKYQNFRPWERPSQWVTVAGNNYYGDVANSAVYKIKGSGNNSVEWTAQIEHNGYYDISVWNPTMQEAIRLSNRRRDRERRDEKSQSYTIFYDQQQETISLDLGQEENDWVLLGNFYLSKGSVKITLTDKVSSDFVIADAVKFSATEANNKQSND